jgi:hypothetical protein
MKESFIICDRCGKEVKVDATGNFGFRLAVCDGLDCGANLPFTKAEVKEQEVESPRRVMGVAAF